MQPGFGERLVDASLIGAERTASLQEQDGAVEGVALAVARTGGGHRQSHPAGDEAGSSGMAFAGRRDLRSSKRCSTV